MQYKNVMEPCSNKDFLSGDAPIKEALTRFQDAVQNIFIVKDDSDRILGKLTSEDLLEAYRLNLSRDNSIEQIISRTYKTVNMTDEVEKNIFSTSPFLIVVDASGEVRGFLTEKILESKLYQQSADLVGKETECKKNPHSDAMGFFIGVNKLISINKQLMDIIKYSSDSIYVTDGNGITVYVNDAFERLTGAPASSVLGKSVFEAENQGIYRPSITAVVLKEKRQVTLIQKGLNGRDLVVTGTPVFDADKKIYMVICNSKDIDELSIVKNYLLNGKSVMIKTAQDADKRSNVIYTSEYMINLMKLVDKVTQVDSTVMITGESGTGKGLIARYIHENSSRANEKMVEINCSAIPDSLFESELFGYETGAFTGAQKGGKLGLMELANKGTLLLDEIGDMPMHMQVKLLKVLQDKKITKVGSLEPVEIDVRIITATNKDIQQLIEKELFRTDLYYRLNGFPIRIASLRERREDIYTLILHFLGCYNKKFGRSIILTRKAQDKLANYSWPGNVRELDHFIERLVIIKEGIVDAEDLELEYGLEFEKTGVKVNNLMPLKEAVDETERQLIRLATRTSQNSYEVAELLDISQASAHRKIKKYT